MAEQAITIDARERVLSDASLGLPGRWKGGYIPKAIYVSNNGHDGNPGTRTYPMRTIQAAVNKSPSTTETFECGGTDTIYVAPGTYPENITIVNRSCLKIVGLGREHTDTVLLNGGPTSGPTITIDESSIDVVLQGLAFSAGFAGVPSVLAKGYGAAIEDCFFQGAAGVVFEAFLSQVRRCQFYFNEVAVGLRGINLPGVDIQDCTFRASTVADIATVAAGSLTPAAATLFTLTGSRLHFTSRTVPDYVNVQGTFEEVALFDCWFAAAAADGGKLELPAGAVVLGRDPAGLVSVTGV